MSILQHVGKKFSHLTVSLYMEVLMLFLVKITNFDDLYVIKEILMLLSKQITFNVLPITSMSKFPQDRLLLFLYIAVTKLDECDATYPTITNQIMSLLYGHDVEMKRFCLYLLIYLNQLQHDTGSKHALFIMEEMQIPPQIVNAVDNFEKNAIRKILTHIHPYLKCFLTEEIRFQHYIKKEDQVLLFLLVNYYPCVIKYLNLSKQETLNMLINFCHCDNEELISAVPAASEFRRLTVCDFLSKNYILYCNEEPILVGDELQMVLNVVMVLLEDEELTVRNAMSNFATNLKVQITLNKRPKQTISGHKWPLIPEKTKEDLLTLGSIVLPKEGAICFIFSWACRHFPDSSTDTSEVFERGELNLYAENVPFMDYCVELLHKLLWRLEDGLNYDDRSIFLEEHTLMVTTVLLDSLLKNPSPMMLYKTKVSVICALKSTIKFLERVQINNNFVNEFKEYLNETIVGYLTKHVEHSDLFFVKKIMRDIYAPVLNYKRRRRS
ncbi:hypothetical protein NQ317_010150 [Molorchus minor]|uniref:Uncharacterized protein n=1 Tax=Molorchus minor TaxID=1323400 RepID=A0ABQ9JFF1_9CUCU|nr:hypothetical protein NQ317_010150 [Molorchus minor]